MYYMLLFYKSYDIILEEPPKEGDMSVAITFVALIFMVPTFFVCIILEMPVSTALVISLMCGWVVTLFLTCLLWVSTRGSKT